ncbi:ABC transporter substrate-binding protein [Fundidesulfovibrio terrae]|uniref:ABC transporter substrate-binding protein n=1 Tax=Fundidesulfovibrio terrae TaxID=2922866 RepID=UPI001FAFEF8E|nr:ABC transporter substrate-binding protein [Fundidesulfovibrio terrae]
MRFAGSTLKFLVIGVILSLVLGVAAWAQEAPAGDAPAPADAAAPAKPAKKHAKPAPKPAKPALKPGEVVPFDQAGPSDQPAAAAPAAAAPAPAASDTGAAAKAADAPSAPVAPVAPVAPALPAAKGAGKQAAKAPAIPAASSDEAPGQIRPQKVPPLPARSKVSGGKLVIGALLPLTGPLSPQGQSSKAAIELAVADVNGYLAESGSSERVSVAIEDTGSSGPKALDRIKALSVAGARLIIGPYSDNEVDAVLDFATKNGMVLLSQGSAGPYLAKPGRNLFRFSPSDAFQAEALAVLASQEGCTQLITIWEGDMYGDELITHIKGQFANQGGQVLAGTRFRPEVSQFATYVADLKGQIDKQVKDKKKLAIVVAARGAQTAGILREAAKLAGMDEAKWYGGDDSALRGSIIEDKTVAAFAAKVRMAFARYGETGTGLYTEVEKRIEERIQAFVDTQAVVAYDLIWLGAFTALASGDDAAALKKAIPATAERFYGASGWMALNEYGDRREDYDFDFWTIKNIDGKFYWVKTARYQFDPGSVKQLIINAPEKD